MSMNSIKHVALINSFGVIHKLFFDNSWTYETAKEYASAIFAFNPNVKVVSADKYDMLKPNFNKDDWESLS